MKAVAVFVIGLVVGVVASKLRWPGSEPMRAVSGVTGWLRPSAEPDGSVTYAWTWSRGE